MPQKWSGPDPWTLLKLTTMDVGSTDLKQLSEASRAFSCAKFSQ